MDRGCSQRLWDSGACAQTKVSSPTGKNQKTILQQLGGGGLCLNKRTRSGGGYYQAFESASVSRWETKAPWEQPTDWGVNVYRVHLSRSDGTNSKKSNNTHKNKRTKWALGGGAGGKVLGRNQQPRNSRKKKNAKGVRKLTGGNPSLDWVGKNGGWVETP